MDLVELSNQRRLIAQPADGFFKVSRNRKFEDTARGRAVRTPQTSRILTEIAEEYYSLHRLLSIRVVCVIYG